MAGTNFFKKAFYIVMSLAVLSLIFNAYLLYRLTNNENISVKLNRQAAGTVGADMIMDCNLCELLVNTTYKTLPENPDQHAMDSVINRVLDNMPTNYNYIVEDIRGRHFEQYKQYIYDRQSSRYIAFNLGYCGN
jgi:hypothetical protein